jgi:hypothetical protein
VGIGAIIRPDKMMYHALVMNDPKKIKEAFMAYNKYTRIIEGKAVKLISKGLTRRRNAEIQLFFS